jgi:hypothetical protein
MSPQLHSAEPQCQCLVTRPCHWTVSSCDSQLESLDAQLVEIIVAAALKACRRSKVAACMMWGGSGIAAWCMPELPSLA